MHSTAERAASPAEEAVPHALVYEMVAGRPIFYRGYEAVVAGRKGAEEVMGSSYLQAAVLTALFRHLVASLPERYDIFTNELGLQLGKEHWRAVDLAIYHKEDLKGVPLQNSYLAVPPEVVIEVDTKADGSGFTTVMDYYYEKTDDLLGFGVKKVIWVFTQTRKVMVAVPDREWVITGWESEVPVIDALNVRLSELVA